MADNSYLALLGIACIYLAEDVLDVPSLPLLTLRRIRRLSLAIALGFLLLIPVQLYSAYVQINTTDLEAVKSVQAIQEQMNALQQAPPSAVAAESITPALTTLQDASADTKTVPPTTRADRLTKLERDLTLLKSQRNDKKKNVIISNIKKSWKTVLMLLIHATFFYGFSYGRSEELEDDVAKDLSPYFHELEN